MSLLRSPIQRLGLRCRGCSINNPAVSGPPSAICESCPLPATRQQRSRRRLVAGSWPLLLIADG